MDERRERALKLIADFQREVFISSDTQLNEKLNDAENLKLFATSVAIVGFTVMGSSIGMQAVTDNETVRQTMYAPVATGAVIASLGLLMFLNAKLTAQEIFYEAKQRGLKIIPGMHRSLEIPQE